MKQPSSAGTDEGQMKGNIVSELIPFNYEDSGFDHGEPVPDEDYLYVAEIIGQGVKIGISKNPERRMKQHRADAEAYGTGLGRVWISTPHLNARENESYLKRSYGSRREYIDTTFDEAVTRASSTKRERSSVEAFEKRTEAVTSFFRSIVTGSAFSQSGIPTFDTPRPVDGDREVICEGDPLTFRHDGSDEWVSMPVRIATHYGEPTLEIGPYSLDVTELGKLIHSLEKFDQTFIPVNESAA